METTIVATVTKFVLEKFWDLLSTFSFYKYSKSNSFVLFVDDERFPIVDSLSEAGWNVKCIEDVTNLQDDDVIRANVIFIDYMGVGKNLSPEDGGLGIIKAIKSTYGKSKRVILYSGHTRFALGKKLDWADGQMAKNSQAYEFIIRIEEELKKIR